MVDHGKVLLDKLMQRYEHSLHANPFQKSSNRRIMYPMKKYVPYDVQDLDIVQCINGALERLQQKGYLTIDYHKEHTNHITRIILVLDHVESIYQEYYGKAEVSYEAIELEALLTTYHEQLHTPWMLSFLDEEMVYLKTKGKLHAIVGKDNEHIKALFQVLAYLDEGHCEYMRVMSVQLFHNTKYFEEEVKSSLLSVVRKYEPTYLEMKQADYELRESELFRCLGFRLYPELIECTGDITFLLKHGQTIHTNRYEHGYIMIADQLEDIERIDVSGIDRVLLIENKTAYYGSLSNRKHGELLIYAGGHFSPVKRRFYELLKEQYHGLIQLHSDIDLGGFLMYDRLKRELFPQLVPYRMDITSYLTYLPYGKPCEDGYLTRLEDQKNKEEMQLFKEVIEAILEHKKTVEQEVMLITF